MRALFWLVACWLAVLPALAGDVRSAGGKHAAAESPSRPISAHVVVGRLFQEYISPVDGDRCSMFPTCSSYSIEAFEKHGLFMGWIMTCDRLIRCGGDEWDLAPRLMDGGRQRCYDPVENNDFWWGKNSTARCDR